MCPARRQRAHHLSVAAVALVLFASAAATTAAGCSTVALDGPPADVNACRPSQMFFVDRVWPEFLSQSYGGKKCSDASCHDAATRGILQIIPPRSAQDPTLPAPTFPLAAGSDWETLYLSAAQEMTCTNIQGSKLYARPAGIGTHGGGKLLDDPAAVEVLLTMWVAASP